ncbi:hypothetical protein L5515_010507 [Caenorhabditis briggsae]|uniref:Uncharacterized protein n=1 Tax=Caenorhabditis briggsae TaxID=6238 RepID=A0AAE9EUU0_CAEBR|nr:hypothetical protein L5515_010507 [Caenorhabditis briggsae]
MTSAKVYQERLWLQTAQQSTENHGKKPSSAQPDDLPTTKSSILKKKSDSSFYSSLSPPPRMPLDSEDHGLC